MPERIASQLLDSPAPTVPVPDGSNQVWPELLLATGPAYERPFRVEIALAPAS